MINQRGPKPRPPRYNHNNNNNNRTVPSLTPSNHIQSRLHHKRIGTVSLPSQSKPIQVPLSTNKNTTNNSTNTNSNNNRREQDLQKLLKQKFKACFVTTKTITVGQTPIPIGTAGKVVLSRHRNNEYCIVFAAPFYGIETKMNPITHLRFGLFA